MFVILTVLIGITIAGGVVLVVTPYVTEATMGTDIDTWKKQREEK